MVNLITIKSPSLKHQSLCCFHTSYISSTHYGDEVHPFSMKCREPSHGSCTDAMA